MNIKESSLFWPAKLKAGILSVLDETLIPNKFRYISVRNTKGAVDVIHNAKTRIFGQFLVVLNTFLLELGKIKSPKKGDFKSQQKVLKKVQDVAHDLNKSRQGFPFSDVTLIIVRWAIMAIDSGLDVKSFVKNNTEGYLESIRIKRLERVEKLSEIIEDGDSILTHYNVSGELAMAAYLCKKQKKDIRFFVAETRPNFEGAKLTCWELEEMGARATLIADNAVGSVMSDRLVNKVIVGSDRSCANGDLSSKVGTYQIAVAARHFYIPFYALTQPSDLIRTGKDIPVEIRHSSELLKFNNKKIIRGEVDGFYPGFDIVPHDLITKSIPISVTENA
ncbi:MAG: hypothetical protein P9X22_08280 [Candidatus Zapsychrus exili]|nr:hypothetical protein [Candidatus Zapsychrus exili]